jgi:hypothetical protein
MSPRPPGMSQGVMAPEVRFPLVDEPSCEKTRVRPIDLEKRTSAAEAVPFVRQPLPEPLRACEGVAGKPRFGKTCALSALSALILL